MFVQVNEDNSVKKAHVWKWVKCFSEERESVTDEEKSVGQQQAELKKILQTFPSRTEENIADIPHIGRANRRLPVRSIAEQVNINRETVSNILTEYLDMMKLCAKMVPKEPTEEEKERRVTICQYLFERQDDILGHVITGDQT